ncbi:MAG TPA: hypothetical protein PKD90_05420, partial [Phnomibacter sp.]|nr:hypothetical protein [Phnomibacter sp.]
MSGVALGLFMGLPFVQLTWLAGLALLSLAGAWAIAALQWRRQSQKFRNIIKRETADPST